MTWWTKKIHPKTKSKFIVCFGTDFYLPSIKSITKPSVEFDTKEYRLINHKFNYPGNATWQPVELKFVDMNGLGKQEFDTAAFLWQILNNTGYAYPYLDPDSDISKNPYYLGVESNTNADGETTVTKVSGKGHHVATQIAFRDDARTTTTEGQSFKTFTTPEKTSTIANSFGGGLGGSIAGQSGNYVSQKISIYQISPENPKDTGAGEAPDGGIISEAWHLINPIVKAINWGDLSYESDELVEYTLSITYDWAIFDRDKIGKPIDFDAEPLQKFMKKFNNAKETVDAEVNIQENLATMTAAANEIKEITNQDDLSDLESFQDKFVVDKETGELFFDADADGERDAFEDQLLSPAEAEKAFVDVSDQIDEAYEKAQAEMAELPSSKLLDQMADGDTDPVEFDYDPFEDDAEGFLGETREYEKDVLEEAIEILQREDKEKDYGDNFNVFGTGDEPVTFSAENKRSDKDQQIIDEAERIMDQREYEEAQRKLEEIRAKAEATKDDAPLYTETSTESKE